jgi:UDP-glucuronate decarboxylase
VVSNVVNQALSGAPVTIYGDGAQTRSFCYIDDLVRGLVALMAHPGPLDGPVNLGNPEEVTVRALVDRVLAMSRSRSRVIALKLPVDDPRRRCPDIARARELLGWSPSVPLRDGLRDTIAWFAAEQGIKPRLVATRPARTGGSGRGKVAVGD